MLLTGFINRIEAGKQLAGRLKKYKNDPVILLAIPRGGVPVAYAVAKETGLPLELILTKKIGHPGNKEYAIGAASLTDYFIIPHENVSQDYIKKEVERIRLRLKEMYVNFKSTLDFGSLYGKTVIIIDDGVATGNTLLATVKLIRKSNPAKIVIAVPVASESAVQKLAEEADEVITLFVPAVFYGVGAFYDNFEQVSDEEVLFYLNQLKE
jgi:predicted phosphoribosyltransferase